MQLYRKEGEGNKERSRSLTGKRTKRIRTEPGVGRDIMPWRGNMEKPKREEPGASKKESARGAGTAREKEEGRETRE